MFKKICLLMITTILLTAQANAGFDVTRMTTVVDDFTGSFTTTKSGRFDDSAFVGDSLTEFTNFHLGDSEDSSGLSGTVSKNISRSNGYLETISDGNLSFVGTENSLNIEFEELSVLFDEELTIIGNVTVNDEVYDVHDLPPFVAGVLRKIFKITRR